jgi:hypothetical protein
MGAKNWRFHEASFPTLVIDRRPLRYLLLRCHGGQCSCGRAPTCFISSRRDTRAREAEWEDGSTLGVARPRHLTIRTINVEPLLNGWSRADFSTPLHRRRSTCSTPRQRFFVENAGQWSDSSVRFVQQGKGANIALTDTGATFQLFRENDSSPASASDPLDRSSNNPFSSICDELPPRFEGDLHIHPKV